MSDTACLGVLNNVCVTALLLKGVIAGVEPIVSAVIRFVVIG